MKERETKDKDTAAPWREAKSTSDDENPTSKPNQQKKTESSSGEPPPPPRVFYIMFENQLRYHAAFVI